VRLAIPLSAIALALGGTIYTTSNWTLFSANSSRQSTDDAVVSADTTMLSARVVGNITAMEVEDYQLVKRGDVIAQIDPREYSAALELAKANLLSARAARANLANQETLQMAAIGAADAQHVSSLAVQEQARQEYERQKELRPAGTEQRLQQAKSAFLQAEASVSSTDAAARQQRAQLSVLCGQEPVLDAQIAAQEANLAAAQLHVEFSSVTAPFDGVVGKRAVHEGDYVGAGTGIITVVPLPNIYVTANFKETQLSRMQPGQEVLISIDTFPGQLLKGRVERLAPASGSTFALLPPDNATGNYTKVVQRVPVRIEFRPGQPLVAALKAGMSANATVITREERP